MEHARNRDRDRNRTPGGELEAAQAFEHGPEPAPEDDRLGRAQQRAAQQQRVAPAVGRAAAQAAAQRAAQQQRVAPAVGQAATQAAAQQP